MEICFSSVDQHRKLAAFYGLSDTHVRRLRRTVAHTIRLKEAEWLRGDDVQKFQQLHEKGVPSMFISSLAFDETTDVLKLPVKGLPSMKWHLLVSMQSMLLEAISVSKMAPGQYKQKL